MLLGSEREKGGRKREGVRMDKKSTSGMNGRFPVTCALRDYDSRQEARCYVPRTLER